VCSTYSANCEFQKRIVEMDENLIRVHSGAIAALSSSSERLVNDPFKEALREAGDVLLSFLERTVDETL